MELKAGNLSVYVDMLVNFTMSGRKQNCVWSYFDKTKVVGKALCEAKCKKCGKQMQELAARIFF